MLAGQLRWKMNSFKAFRQTRIMWADKEKFIEKGSKEDSYSFNKNLYQGDFRSLFLMLWGGIDVAKVPVK